MSLRLGAPRLLAAESQSQAADILRRLNALIAAFIARGSTSRPDRPDRPDPRDLDGDLFGRCGESERTPPRLEP
jgi:hypothetical protein